MFKLEGVKQATEVSSLVGKTFTVGKVTGVSNGLGNGLFKWLFLVPSGEAASNRQAAQLAGLAGKTVTVGHSPAIVGGVGNWLVLNSGSGAAAGAVAVSAKGAAESKLMLMQLEGTQQVAQMKSLAGKSFTVIPSPMVGGNAKGWLFMKPLGGAGVAGKDMVALQIQGGTQANLSGLIGKSFTVCKAPLATGNVTGSWIVLKPVGGAVAKGAATGAAVVAKGSGSMALPPLDGWGELGAAKTTAKAAAVQGGNLAAASTPLTTKALASAGSSASATAAVAKGGTIWSGTGLSLGLGMGLGPWGPALLAGFLVVSGYGAYRYYRNRQALDAEG
jgi:hypothetical protein